MGEVGEGQGRERGTGGGEGQESERGTEGREGQLGYRRGKVEEGSRRQGGREESCFEDSSPLSHSAHTWMP